MLIYMSMNKIKDTLKDVLPVPLPDPKIDKGLEVELPAGLTLKELEHSTTAQIDEKIKAEGAAIGYAGMVKLAAGHGKTPAGTQYHACAFLLDRAKELEGGSNEDAQERLKELPAETLMELINTVAEKVKLSAASDLPPIDVECTTDSAVHKTPEDIPS